MARHENNDYISGKISYVASHVRAKFPPKYQFVSVEGRTYGQTDGWTDGWTARRMDVVYNNIPAFSSKSVGMMKCSKF